MTKKKNANVKSLIEASLAEESEYRKAKKWLRKEVRLRENRMILHLRMSAETIWDAVLSVLKERIGFTVDKRPAGFRKWCVDSRREYLETHELPAAYNAVLGSGNKELMSLFGHDECDVRDLFRAMAFWNGVDGPDDCSDGDIFEHELKECRKKVRKLMRSKSRLCRD